MASTYSTNLKIELQATGENSGTWGTITNTNLGTALEQAIVGYGNPSYASDANLTLTYTDTNAAQAARALVLNVTSAVSLTATRELVVPTIQKQYIVQNNTTGSQSITVKTSAGTGITVPNGRKAHLYVDGTNVIYMDDYVDINGGAIDGTPIGASSASTGAFTTLSASGNLTFSSTGQRITGDMSNATIGNRLAVQNSVTNGNTVLGLLPNGTATTSAVQINNNSDTTAALGFGNLQVSTTEFQIAAAIRNAGTYLPMTFYTGGSERMRLDTSGRELIGLTDAATVGGVNNSALQIFGGGAARINVMRGDANANSPAVFLSKSRSTSSGTFSALQSGDGCGAVSFYGDDGSSLVTNVARIEAFVDGAVSGSTVPGRLVFSTNQGSSTASATERMRIDSSGNVGIGTASLNAYDKVTVGGTLPSSAATSVGFVNRGSIPSSTTGANYGFAYSGSTAAASFTLTTNYAFAAFGTSKGAGSTITNDIGFYADSGLTNATNNYGFYSNIASGTNRWNFYANGTARNYFAGGVEDSYGNLRKIPQSGSDKTGSYTLATTDVGQFIGVGSGGSIIVPNSTFATGDVVSIFNNTAGNITITTNPTSSYIAGTNTTKASVTLATRGVATILFISGTVCVLSGNVS